MNDSLCDVDIADIQMVIGVSVTGILDVETREAISLFGSPDENLHWIWASIFMPENWHVTYNPVD